MAEIVILDPSEVASGRTALDITQFVAEVGPDWGDAAIEQYLAEAERGQVPVDFRLPNREVRIPLILLDRGAVTFETIRRQVQAKAALFQREGGWLKRTTAEGPWYADVVDATLKLGGSTAQALWGIDADAVLTLTCLPDWYGDERALDSVSELSLPEIAAVLEDGGVTAVIEGDYPARCRIVVDELDGDVQRGLLWGFRCRHYSAAATAKLAYEAEDLDPLDAASATSLAGASGGNVVQHTNLGTNWTPVLGTNIGGTTFLTHTGSYRVFAGVHSPDGADVSVRFVWDVGDLVLPEENDPWTFPNGPKTYHRYIADLGEVRLDRVPVGTHRWQGQIQAKGTVGGRDILIDRIWFLPIDESAGRLRVQAPTVDGLADYAARDEFNQSAGALTGKTAAVGGTWLGSGDADDFQVEATGHTAQRTAVSDANLNTGRFARLDVNLSATLAQVDYKLSAISGNVVYHGLLLRYVDTSNWVSVSQVGALERGLNVTKCVAGVRTRLEDFIAPNVNLATDTWWSIRAVIDTAGRWYVWIWPQGGSPGDPLVSSEDTDLATGGPLATGDVGIYDAWTVAQASTRSYVNFLAAVPVQDAVVMANQSAELRTDGIFREDASGSAYGPLVSIGDLPRVPPSGLEDRPVELFVKPSRGDLGQLPDSGIDDVRAQVFYRPSWVFVPASIPGS